MLVRQRMNVRLAGVFTFFGLFVYTLGQEQDLYHYLMQNYTKDIRPVKNVSNVVHVVLHPTLEYLVQVDELHESFTALFWFSMMWFDDFLVWNAADYNGLDKIHLPAQAIWRPDMIVYGAVKTDFALTLEDTVAVVQANGHVAVELAQVVQMYCPFDIVLFPFDQQNCTMEFGSWTYSSDRVTFAPLTLDGNTEYLNDQPEWDIVSFKSNLLQGVYNLGDAYENETFNELYYHFVFKRKPTYYVINLIVPSFLITLLSLIGLFAPFSSTGERQEQVTLGLTSLLAMALILNIVSTEVPKTSKGIPILGRFVLYELIVVAMAMLTTVVIIITHRAAVIWKRQPPTWLLRILLLDHTNAKNHPVNPNFDTLESHRSIGPMKVAQRQSLGRVLNELMICKSYLQTIVDVMQQKLQTEHNAQVWIGVFDRIDLFCLLFYFFGNLTMALVLLLGN